MLSKLNLPSGPETAVKLRPLEVSDVDQIRAELEAFVHSAQSKSPPVVSGEDGLAAVEVAERIVGSM